tara:strand:+ start:1735 stop:2343 length:609 start_codon:yes stop_codon:yes gene_type:complete
MEESNFITNAWKTCLEILTDRGYTPDETYFKLNAKELDFLAQKNSLDIVAKDELRKKFICVKFILTEKVKSAYVKELVNEIKDKIPIDHTYEMIFVLKNKPNSTLKKLEKDRDLGDIQIRSCKELQFNITKHVLVPQHIKLTDDEVKAIMNRYSIHSKTQLPLILREDPIVRYYNFKSGDVLKIPTSNGSLNSSYVNYRCVR